MSKFKVGDRVRAKRGIMAPGGCAEGYVGTVTGVDARVDGCEWEVLVDGRIYSERAEYYWELVTPTLDNLSVDDRVRDDDGEVYTVAAVIGRVVVLEDSDGSATDFYTVKDLKDNDFTVVTESELTEVTLDEIAKLKGVPVEQIRVKD